MRITLLSNGHGEDVVGALLAEAFLACDDTLELQAFPTVGRGDAYERLGVPILGPRLALPSGGFMLHSLNAFRGDMRAGFAPMTAAQLRALRGLETDVLVVVGDVYALLLSSLVGTRQRFYMQTLVSAWQRRPPNRLGGRRGLNRYFMERFSAPERLLMRRLVRHSYVRDAPTAALLETFGLAVSALGNPMLDALRPAAAMTLPLPLEPPVVALLPGTRSHRFASLETMVRALASWPEATGLVAWADAALPAGRNWKLVADGIWQGAENVYLLIDRFAEVLGAAQLALGTAGTAHEQAAASGLPVVAFAAPPLYTPAFLANQRRLLGAALSVCDAEPRSVADVLRALWYDEDRYRRAAAAGRERMGASGGSAAIVCDVLARASNTSERTSL